MRRAIRWVCDEHGLTVDALKRLDSQTLSPLQDYAIAIAEDMKFNQLKYFRPFEYQKRFFRTGLTSNRRGILAANRVGKTVSTCYEVAYHLTGQYPTWWEGKRFESAPTILVAGENWQQVCLVLQNELMGVQDAKLTENIGTGSIPRDCIIMDTLRSDAQHFLTAEIKHVSGAKSNLIFSNYTQEVRGMQGFKLNMAVFDEQPKDEFFSELVTRTATTQGQVMCSFTPLKGINGLVGKFWNHEEGYEFVRVSWDDVDEYDLWGEPFLLKETRRQLELDFMPHEREARIAGKPVMGRGAVFQIRNWPTYKTGEFDFKQMSGVEQLIALDLGLVNDATVITRIFHQPRTGMMWIDRQIIVTGMEEANPTNYIHHLKRPEVMNAPIVLPADGSTKGRYTMTSLSIRELFEEHGLNVIKKPIMNPPDSMGKVTNEKAYGINQMRQMLEAQTLMINENCTTLITQCQNYYVDAQQRYSDPDDAIDSARYAVLGCLNKLSEPLGSNGRITMDFARARIHDKIEQRKMERFRDPLKRAYD